MEFGQLHKNKIYLVTGVAGFIGYFLAKSLLEQGCRVVSVDNLNDYYDVDLKKARLELLQPFERFTFLKCDISDKKRIDLVFTEHEPNIVINLAAQAGVRYSIKHPEPYISSNINGFFNILECCRRCRVEHLLFASSSSVYGNNKKVPFEESDMVDHPISLYAATKKTNELMAYTYSYLYNIPATGLRFFTVYGPLGRPDMAYFAFTESYFAGKAIKIYNNGDFDNDLYRDFTYIDDVVDAMVRLLARPPVGTVPYRLYNIGNSRPEKLMHFIETLEGCLSRARGKGVRFKKKYEPLKPGDVPATYASTKLLEEAVGFKPETNIEEGLQRFADWYVEYYKVQEKDIARVKGSALKTNGLSTGVKGKMNILVAGGAGFIGSHTCLALLEAGYDVIVVDNLCNSRMETLDRMKEISGKEFLFFKVDVTNEMAVDIIFDTYPVDGVIHFAGFKAVGESVEKPLEYYHNNIVSTMVLARMCRKYGVKRFVFSSSATVYGDNKVPFVETMEPKPAVNPYGWTKMMSEQVLSDLARVEQDWAVALLRYFNPVGAHESGLIGEAPAGIPNNLMPYITQVARGKLEKLHIFGSDYPTADGTGVRDYIHVCDLAEGHLRALDRLAPGLHIYNLGTGRGTSVLELVRAFEETNDIKLLCEVVERRVGDVAESYADVTKAFKELGWEAKRNISDMCRDAWLFEKKRDDGDD